MKIEEVILLNEIRKKNHDVFEMLFQQYYPVLMRFAEGYLYDQQECEDVVQSFFISFWTKAEFVDIKTSIKSYFFSSIKNLCINKIRDLKVKDKNEILFVESLLNSGDEEIIFEPEIFEQIRNAVESLPDQMAEVFRMRYFEGMQNKEIAQDLKVSEGTVKKQLNRARNLLRQALQNNCGCIFFL